MDRPGGLAAAISGSDGEIAVDIDRAADFNLAKVLKPVGEAYGLANPFYTDPDIFAAERESLFFSTWAAIGFDKDVPEPGSMYPVRFHGVPLVIVRGKDGALRVFENVCRHRGMMLVGEPRETSVIRCPYHAWTYGLDGRLRATPHVGGPGVHEHERICADTHSLNAVRSHVFLGVVFVNMSGDAPAFDDHATTLLDRWSDFAGQQLYTAPDSGFSLSVASNWKLAVENYCESYHLPFIHPGLNSYSRLEDHYNIEAPGTFSGQGTTVYNPQLDADGRRFRDFADLPEKWDRAADYVALYPNVLLGVHRDHIFAMILMPQDVARTQENVAIYYADAAMTDAAQADLRARNAAAWRAIFEEDIAVVEGMQQGRAGRAFDGGVFSPVMDGPTHCFHRWAAERFIGGQASA